MTNWNDVPSIIKEDVEMEIMILKFKYSIIPLPREQVISKCLALRIYLEQKYPILKNVFPPLEKNY